jgi:phosphotransacetylase
VNDGKTGSSGSGIRVSRSLDDFLGASPNSRGFKSVSLMILMKRLPRHSGLAFLGDCQLEIDITSLKLSGQEKEKQLMKL